MKYLPKGKQGWVYFLVGALTVVATNYYTNLSLPKK